jgi:DNA-binding Lrp family transcriptional regulator
LDKFINIYNIENKLKEFFTNFKNFEELSKKYNIKIILYIIKIFKLQDKFSIKNVCESIPNLKEVIKNLYGSYNVNKAMLNELNEYVNSHIEKNSVELFIINEIFEINENNPEFDKDIKKYIYDNFLYFDKDNIEENYLKKYYTFLISNKIENFHTEYDILSLDNIYCLINDYNLYETALYLLKNLEKEKLDKIDNKLLNKIISNFRSDQKKEIKEFLEIFPNKIGNIITHFKDKGELKELLAILKYAKKADKLSDEIANEIDKDKYYGILLNKYKRNYQEKHQIYSIIEFVTKSEKYFKIFFPILERIIRKSNDENDVKLLYTIIDIATKKIIIQI